jgi:hypothetical protein
MILATALSNWYHIIIAPRGQSIWNGSLWSNMYAWLICGILAILWGRRKFIKWNHKREAIDEARHNQHMNLLKKQHQEQMEHISKIHKHLGIKL